ncbi:MAG: hypothetical protein NTX22_17825 [Ignavibacteriales bacterium]|nr:hypothetical protein [Ignavibacteriales bacterium]
MKPYINILRIVFCFIVVFISENLFAQTSGYKIVNKILIEGENRWDYLSIDKTHNRLFVSNSSKVHVIDLQSDSKIGELIGLNGVHGIEFAPEFNKGFITSGRDSSVIIFNLDDLKQKSRIKIDGKNPDAIIYDSFTKRIFVFNHSSNSASAIDAESGKLLKTFPLEGMPEFAASDLKGKMFVNLEDKNAVDVIDTRNLKVIAKWNIAPCESPTGMSIDRKNKRLFITGDNQKLAIVDYSSGQVVTTMPIGSKVDGCAFDPGTNLIFTSNGEGTITIIKEKTPDDYTVIDNIQTVKGARTITLDEKTHKVYTLSMIEKPDSKEKSFGVLILDNNK